MSSATVLNHSPLFGVFSWPLALILTAVFCFVLLTHANTASGQDKLTTVLSPAAFQKRLPGVSADIEPLEAYEVRTGHVELALDAFFQPSMGRRAIALSSEAFAGRSLAFAFFPDQHFDIDIIHESRPRESVLSLQGRVSGSSIAAFSMTVTDQSYLITLQDLDTAMVFRVVGATDSGIGRVLQIDQSKMPPRIYSPPLIPGEEEKDDSGEETQDGKINN